MLTKLFSTNNPIPSSEVSLKGDFTIQQEPDQRNYLYKAKEDLMTNIEMTEEQNTNSISRGVGYTQNLSFQESSAQNSKIKNERSIDEQFNHFQPQKVLVSNDGSRRPSHAASSHGNRAV